MLLAFDVGNTNIVLGLYKERKLIQSWRMETDKNKSADEYGMIVNNLFAYEGLNPADVEDAIISTVVPSLTYTLQHLTQKYFNVKAIVVGPGIKTGLVVKYDNPKALGADRIVNAVAGLANYKTSLIIIDFGTATTVDAITEKGEFLGGTIVPGIKVAANALFEKTAKLPRVELEAPGHVICKNTNEGIQSGVVYGSMGSIIYLVDRMKKEIAAYTGSDKPITVIATGGLATLISSEIDCIDVIDKNLTLTGLEVLYEKNKPGRKRSKQTDNGQ